MYQPPTSSASRMSVSPPSVSSSAAVSRTGASAVPASRSVPPRSTAIPDPRVNFTTVPAPISSVTPLGTATQSLTTCTLPLPHDASPESRPYSMATVPLFSTATSAVFVPFVTVCQPSASFVVFHADAAPPSGFPIRSVPCTSRPPKSSRASTRPAEAHPVPPHDTFPTPTRRP